MRVAVSGNHGARSEPGPAATAAEDGQRLRSSGTETPTGPDEAPQGPALGSRLTHAAALRSRGLRVLPQIPHRPSPQPPEPRPPTGPAAPPAPPRTSHRRSAEADPCPGCAAEGAGPSAGSAPSAPSGCGVRYPHVAAGEPTSVPHPCCGPLAFALPYGSRGTRFCSEQLCFPLLG
ncbi:hypothetical protein LUU34_00789400 [Aix galericulata]|nr:hypothetical protein LUU34_00789400 [Aix galericulata]